MARVLAPAFSSLGRIDFFAFFAGVVAVVEVFFSLPFQFHELQRETTTHTLGLSSAVLSPSTLLAPRGLTAKSAILQSAFGRMPRLQLQPKTGPSKPQWGTPTANPADAQASWADVHQPRSLAELSLHFSKRNALANWLTKACAFDPCADPRVPVLVLFGGSGIGKSSAVELTCVDMGISVVQWNQDMIDSDSTSSVSLYGSRRRPGSQNESGYGDLVHDLFAVHHSSAGRVEVA